MSAMHSNETVLGHQTVVTQASLPISIYLWHSLPLLWSIIVSPVTRTASTLVHSKLIEQGLTSQ